MMAAKYDGVKLRLVWDVKDHQSSARKSVTPI